MSKLMVLWLAALLVGISACANPQQQSVASNRNSVNQETNSPQTPAQISSSNVNVNAQLNKRIGKSDKKSEAKDIGYEKERDPKIEKALREIYDQPSDSDLRYHYNKLDLNDDGKQDALVFVSGINCGTGGCDLLVLKGNENGYELLQTYLTRTPVIVLGTKTNGWRDLIISVSGGGTPKGYWVKLQFDGKNYPEDIAELSALRRKETKGVGYLSGIDGYQTGFPFK